MAFQNGNTVTFDYTLKVDGEIIDSSQGRQPFSYTSGQSQIIPGLERELQTMRIGEERTVNIPPEDAYGPVNLEGIQKVPRSKLPPDIQPEVDMLLEMRGPEGESIPLRISAVHEDAVTVDFNHPLAGKTLEFTVKIISIE